MEDSFTNAKNESEKAFKNSTIYMEKAFFKARHIEFQVVGDSRGNAYCLGERECCVQRRHQKILEETPSPRVSPELRHQHHGPVHRGGQEVRIYQSWAPSSSS